MTVVSRAIGDLSKEDKEYLKGLAETHRRILEGGVGASTQILTHYTEGKVTTYDTSPEWIKRVKLELFPKVGVKGSCKFNRYEVGTTKIEGRYDLAFVDLQWEFRLEFALKAWATLVPGGLLVLHDARRSKDIHNILQLLTIKYRELQSLEICPENSNMAVFTKRDKRCDFIDWHSEEKMTKEQLGIDWQWEK